MKKTGIAGKIIIAATLILMYIPIVTVVVFSFNSGDSISQFGGFSFEWYAKLFKSMKYAGSLRNSLVVGALSVALSAVIGSFGAVGMAARRFRGKGLFEGVALFPIMIPEIILGVAFLFLFSTAGIGGGYTRQVAAHTTFCIPYVYLMVKARLSDADSSVFEAARDLGAGRLRAFAMVTLPLIAPGVVSGMLISFALSFDDVIISRFLSSPGKDLLPVHIYSSLRTGLTPETNALFTLLLLAVVMAVLGSAFIGKLRKQA